MLTDPDRGFVSSMASFIGFAGTACLSAATWTGRDFSGDDFARTEAI